VDLEDVATISTIKQEIRALRKQKEEILASSRDQSQIERVRRKIKKLKHLTRRLARAARPKQASPPSPAPEGQAASG